jgi:hypothetical protein
VALSATRLVFPEDLCSVPGKAGVSQTNVNNDMDIRATPSRNMIAASRRHKVQTICPQWTWTVGECR